MQTLECYCKQNFSFIKIITNKLSITNKVKYAYYDFSLIAICSYIK